ncbi:unnamed protein product [Protopolystoma xenopodis]|uniref:Uncharacterized protein n=1 Tax=Protopolystoma xenopodis TaxID=117903 RepID=A0A3S5CLE8_9PLAT|nr:unnamed protein product [Protopolystoma xenopodis]
MFLFCLNQLLGCPLLQNCLQTEAHILPVGNTSGPSTHMPSIVHSKRSSAPSSPLHAIPFRQSLARRSGPGNVKTEPANCEQPGFRAKESWCPDFISPRPWSCRRVPFLVKTREAETRSLPPTPFLCSFRRKIDYDGDVEQDCISAHEPKITIAERKVGPFCREQPPPAYGEVKLKRKFSYNGNFDVVRNDLGSTNGKVNFTANSKYHPGCATCCDEHRLNLSKNKVI